MAATRKPWASMSPEEEARVLARVKTAAESGDFTMPAGDDREIACLREICRQQQDALDAGALGLRQRAALRTADRERRVFVTVLDGRVALVLPVAPDDQAVTIAIAHVVDALERAGIGTTTEEAR